MQIFAYCKKQPSLNKCAYDDVPQIYQTFLLAFLCFFIHIQNEEKDAIKNDERKLLYFIKLISLTLKCAFQQHVTFVSFSTKKYVKLFA